MADYFEDEEEFHNRDKKQSRKERKILSQKDRSQFKKTDQKKESGRDLDTSNLEKGRVVAIIADEILVDSSDLLYSCRLKGNLKKEIKQIKNLIAVGDFVLFHPTELTIHAILDRYSILSRTGQLTPHKQQLIAVNIDQVFITVSIGFPPLKPNLVDRYIIASFKGNMQPIVIINKIDLLHECPREKALFDELVSIYQSIDIPCFPVSTISKQGIEAIEEKMKGKSSVFSGQSGTGKTSLINILTGSSYLTGEVITKTKKGSHTTTNTRLLPLEGETFCVDTPGIKSFALWDISETEIRSYFVEIASYAEHCKFPNCKHIQEPDCAVKSAVETGEISHLRFDSYCALISSLKQQHKR